MDFDFGYSFGLPSVLSPFARLIPTFAGSQYGTIDTPIISSNFEVEIVLASTQSVAGMIIIDSDAAGLDRPYVFIDAGIISWNTGIYDSLTIDDVAATSGVTAFPTDGKVHTILGAGTTTANFGTIGNQFGLVAPFQGQILSVKFTDAGTVVANYVFDSGSDLYQLPRGEGLGVQLVTGDNSTFDTSIGDYLPRFGASLTNPSNRLRVTNQGGTGLEGGGLSLSTVIGKTYIIQADGFNGTAAGFRLGASNTIDGALLSFTDFTSDTLKAAHIFTATATETFIQLIGGSASLGTYSEFDNVGTQQLPDLACLLTNFATTDWNRYTQQRNIAHDAGVIGEAWVGDNLVVNGQFNTDTDWTKQGNWTISGGTANSSGIGASEYIRQENILNNDDKLLLKYNLLGYSAGNIVPVFGAATGINRSSNGSFSEIITPDAALHVQFQGVNNFIGSIDDVIVNKLLEVA